MFRVHFFVSNFVQNVCFVHQKFSRFQIHNPEQQFKRMQSTRVTVIDFDILQTLAFFCFFYFRFFFFVNSSFVVYQNDKALTKCRYRAFWFENHNSQTTNAYIDLFIYFRLKCGIHFCVWFTII